MSVDVFLDLLSTDESVRINAYESIIKEIEKPTFANYLLENLKIEDEQLLQLVSLILLECVRKCLIKCDNDFRIDFLHKLVTTIFEINIIARANIEECIIMIGTSLIGKDGFDFYEILQRIFETLSGATPMNICTAMSLAVRWMKQEPSSSFLAELGSNILPLLRTVVENNGFHAIAIIAEVIQVLLERREILIDGSFDDILSLMNRALLAEGDDAVMKMKIGITRLYSCLVEIVFDKWTGIADIRPFLEHFANDLFDGLFEAAVTAGGQSMNWELFNELCRLYGLFVKFGIRVNDLVTEEFLQKFVIGAAKLTDQDLQDFEMNCEQFIWFCSEHKNPGFFSRRVCASDIVHHVIMSNDENVEKMTALLSKTSEDPIEFEAQVYLLGRIAEDNGLPTEIFESFFDLLTVEQPPYLVSSLIRLVIPMMADYDNVIGIAVAEHFIVNAECPIIQVSACAMMLACFSEFEDHLQDLGDVIELNIMGIVPVLLQLADGIQLPEPTVLLQKLFVMKGGELLQVVPEIIEHLFVAWRNTQDDDVKEVMSGPAVLSSMKTAVEMVPSNCEMMEALTKTTLKQLQEDMMEFPESASIADQIGVAAVFSRKLTRSIDAQVTFIGTLWNLELDPSLFMDSFVELIAPIMFAQKKSFDYYAQLQNLCSDLLNPETDNDCLTECLVLAGCMIQSGGSEFLSYVPVSLEILAAKKKRVILVGCLYVLGSAMVCDESAACTFINEEIASILCDNISIQVGLAYRELKLSMIVLIGLMKAGFARACEIAIRIVDPLQEMRSLDERIMQKGLDSLHDRETIHHEEQLLSLTPLLLMPIDSYDEVTVLTTILQHTRAVNDLPDGLNRFVK